MPAAPKPIPGAAPGPHGPIPPTPGQKVSFRHPSTGEKAEGHIHAQGTHGATIVDGQGTTHRIPHGGYMHADAAPAGEEGAPKPDGKLVLAAARKHLELGPDAPLAVLGAAAMLVVGGVDTAHKLQTQQIGFSGGKLQIKPDKLQTDDPALVAIMQKLAQKNPRGPVFVANGQPITEQSLTTYVRRFGLANGAAAAPGAFAPPPSPAPGAAPPGKPPPAGGKASEQKPLPSGKPPKGKPAPMAKASAGALDLPAELGEPLQSWEHLGFTCEFRKGTNGLGLVTIEGPEMPLPLHEVVGDLSRGKKFSFDAITCLRDGRAPPRGIFQAVSQPAAR